MNEYQDSLKSFYGYKETFAKAAQWLPIPQGLTWIHTSNPYDDIEDDDREQQRAREAAMTYPSREMGNELSHADYSAFTEGLAALSAVASQDQYNLATPSTTMERTPMQNPQQTPSPQQLDFILNASAHMANSDHQLDPQLQMLEAAAAHSPSFMRAQSPPRDAQP